MVRRLFSAIALVVFGTMAAVAQVGSGSLKGKVTDKKTGEPLPFVNVVVENKGTQVAGGATDFDGNYFIKPIDPGTYEVLVSYVGYQPLKIEGVVINNNKITFQDLQLNSGIELTEFEVVQYTVHHRQGRRRLGRYGHTRGHREDASRCPHPLPQRWPVRKRCRGQEAASSIRGARTENTYHYIDGVKVPAGAGTSLQSAIEEVTSRHRRRAGELWGCDRRVIDITTRGEPGVLQWPGIPHQRFQAGR
ncbi:MAG: carboxypeptidase-like regulatory domain-containing protein [Flavobacteriales bacterium]|nr:carboxypeptidase-like regulatory domain-containing protein [Flavobacteriales bacterium]